tara:strand:+ start:77 stop:280 length:204 start_codon:yes stop_codon:yes gene_type:complete
MSLLGTPPNQDRDGLLPGLGNWIVEMTDPIDEMVSTAQPQPDLESTVVVPDPGWFLQHPSPLLGIRA